MHRVPAFRWAVLAGLLGVHLGTGGRGAEEPATAPLAPPATAPPAPALVPPPASGDTFRPLGPQLFPLYQHYLRTADQTEVRNLLYLYTATDNPNGSWSRLLVPLFYRGHDVKALKDLFYLFPLLFFQKRSPQESFNLALPFYYERRIPDSYARFIVPFWYHGDSDRRRRDDVLFPLFRHTVEKEGPVTKTRFGLWKVLEFWESRAAGEDRDRAALTFFNWKEEAKGGAAAYRYSWARDGEVDYGRTHLFPFYWHGNLPDSKYLWALPFYGQTESSRGKDRYFPLLLSRIGAGGAGGERRLDVLFPLFHYARSSESYSIASYPFFDYSRDETGSSWGLLLWLYRTRLASASGKRTHSILFPLGHFDVEPDGSKGERWLIPYLETFEDKRLWRFVLPLYGETQWRSGGTTDWFIRVGLPLFFSMGAPEDYFAMGFPLYWASRDGPRRWEILAPLYYRIDTATSLRLHVLPFFSYRSFPSRKQTLVGGPLYVQERFYDLRGTETGFGHHFLWPFFAYERRDDGYRYRALPLFGASRQGDNRNLLLTPFYFVQEGPTGKHRYILPFYGRYQTDTITRDLYAALTYIHTVERDPAGKPSRVRDDYLWGLAAHEKDLKSGATHTHVLPAAYWATRSPAVDRTVAGPFYYSHRIAKGDNEVHRLQLVLGNLYFSSRKEAPLLEEGLASRNETAAAGLPATARGDAGEPTYGGGGGPAEPAGGADREAEEIGTAGEKADPASGETGKAPAAPAPTLIPEARAVPRTGEVYRDQGILWPLHRRYWSREGEKGKWILPFYFNLEDDITRNLALFPVYFRQDEKSPYTPSYFRYFFLYDQERWRGGYRQTVGQLLYDWKAEEITGSYRLRVLYPLLEYSWNREGHNLWLTPFANFSARDRRWNNYVFPFFWDGRTERKTPAGEWRVENRHFFLFPFYGTEKKGHRQDHYVLIPLFHLRQAPDSLRFELWPLLFVRDEPGVKAVRAWPFHADESGFTAGNFWVSRIFFLSKRFETLEGWRYRLDPFLFRATSTADQFSIGALFELLAYRRQGPEVSYRAIPLVFGYSRDQASATGVIPFLYWKNFGKEEIDYGIPWRFLFLNHHFEGASGERHTGILWKLFEYTDNPNRASYHEAKVLERLFFKRRTETSSQLEVNPFFSYYRDETADETIYSVLLSLYRNRTVQGRTTHTVFFLFNF